MTNALPVCNACSTKKVCIRDQYDNWKLVCPKCEIFAVKEAKEVIETDDLIQVSEDECN